MKNPIIFVVVTIMFIFVCADSSLALPTSTTDLWDISQGSTVTGDSGVLYYRDNYKSSINNMFGAYDTSTTEHYNTIFKDYIPPGNYGASVSEGYVHWVEWQTSLEMTLRSFNLVASHDGSPRDIRYRGFTDFYLYVGIESIWTEIYHYQTDADGNLHYDGGETYTAAHSLELAIDVAPVTSQYFRAEFIQAPVLAANAAGSRVIELDGYDTFLDGSTSPGPDPIPEPATIFLLGSGLAGLLFYRRKRK